MWGDSIHHDAAQRHGTASCVLAGEHSWAPTGREPCHPPDDTALVPAVAFHVEIAVVGYGEDVGRHLPYLLVGVLADVLRRVDGEQLVGVHGYQDGARVCLQAARDMSLHCLVGMGRSLPCADMAGAEGASDCLWVWLRDIW